MRTNPRQTLAASLLAGAAALTAIVQIPGVAWADSFGLTHNVWNFSALGHGVGYSDCHNACTNGSDWLLQMGGPLLVASLLVLACAAALGFLGRKRLAGIVGLVGAALAVGMIILFSVGVSNMMHGAANWSTGFYLAILAAVAALAGALGALVPATWPASGGRLSTAPEATTRRLQCPKCATVNTVPRDVKPLCANCGFTA